MKTFLFGVSFLFLCCLTTPLVGQSSRPPINGISHMCLYASDRHAAEDFYVRILGAAKAADPQNAEGARYYFSPTQYVEVLPLPAEHDISRMACVAYSTTDATALQQYLRSKGVSDLSEIRSDPDGSRWFETKDPEKNVIQFVQAGQGFAMPAGAQPIGTHMIHMGYLVHDRAAEDRFYKQVLGFKAYWFGSKQADRVDWVSQQVPDGHDWVEYMLVGDGSTTPLTKVDARQLGVLNHFSLGVVNMEQAVTTLYAGERLPPRHDGPQMGKDGKWQANFYDPDGTRVELMEFKPAMKPCCSPFTAEDPTP